jgi:carbon storage regulator CsrA
VLVLSRKKGERILVPECGVSVEVLAVRGNTIRLGISAPPTVVIRRGQPRPPGRPRPAERPH